MLKDWNCRLLLYLFQRICSKLVKGKDVAKILELGSRPLFFHIFISYRPSVVAVFLGDYTQKFKLKGCYIEKVLYLCSQKHMKYENGAFGFRYFLRGQPVGCAS